jgi:oligoribonuclease
VKNDLLFIDMETTGLDARSEVPLEVGLAITDEWGQKRCEKSWLIHDKDDIYASRIVDAKVHPFVGPMHEKSGLWRALDTYLRDGIGTVWSRAAADENMVNWLASNGVSKATLPLTGNSIGSLDRPFCLIHFPRLNEWAHYRNIDISSFKETCRRVNPELFDSLRHLTDAKDDAKHRVLDDINASIVEYKAYLDNFFFTSLGD